MIEKLLHIFPVGEILEVLEANEVQRPVTIRYICKRWYAQSG
jgi:hypothetical protein